MFYYPQSVLLSCLLALHTCNLQCADIKVPELRRVPAIVVMKVKKEIGCFLEEIETDGARYYCTDKQVPL